MESVKPGWRNSPCRTCPVEMADSCSRYKNCEQYKTWINACWADFNRYARPVAQYRLARRYKVRSRRDGRLVAFGTAEECTSQLHFASRSSFMSMITRVRQGANRKYEIEIIDPKEEKDDGSNDYDSDHGADAGVEPGGGR